MRIQTLILCLAIFSAGLFPNLVSAQFSGLQNTGTGGAAPVLQLQPEFPQPYEETVVSIINGGNAAYGSNITWFLDGVEIPSTQNKREVELVVGNPGETQTLTAILTKPNGTRSSIVKKITPLYVDLIIEPQTHVPEFYLGRALPSVGSTINVTALISGKNILNPDLNYTWRVGRVVIGGGTLRGQNKISFEVPLGNFPVLTLEVSDLQGNDIAQRAILFPSVLPTILFYESNTLFGLKETPVDNPISLIGNNTTVRAEPYYLDSRVYNQPDILEWEINGDTYTDVGQNPYEVTLQRTGFSGRTSLNIHVRDTTEFLQGAEGSLDINI